MTTWLYIKSEPSLWTVGFYRPDSKWEPESDHGSPDQAATRVRWLNGAQDSEVVAAELEAQAGAFEYNADELDDPKAEYWRAAAQLLRDRVAELRDGA